MVLLSISGLVLACLVILAAVNAIVHSRRRLLDRNATIRRCREGLAEAARVMLLAQPTLAPEHLPAFQAAQERIHQLLNS
jgi:hypothetical protein